jgi:hypothetical protein
LVLLPGFFMRGGRGVEWFVSGEPNKLDYGRREPMPEWKREFWKALVVLFGGAALGLAACYWLIHNVRG